MVCRLGWYCPRLGVYGKFKQWLVCELIIDISVQAIYSVISPGWIVTPVLYVIVGCFPLRFL